MKNKVFGEFKGQISFIGNQTAGHGDRIAEAWGQFGRAWGVP